MWIAGVVAGVVALSLLGYFVWWKCYRPTPPPAPSDVTIPAEEAIPTSSGEPNAIPVTVRGDLSPPESSFASGG